MTIPLLPCENNVGKKLDLLFKWIHGLRLRFGAVLKKNSLLYLVSLPN